MVEQSKLERALRLQRETYALLKWLGSRSASESASLVFRFRHDLDRLDLAAPEWLEQNAGALPLPELTLEERRDLANLFASALTSSFDLVDDDLTRRVISPWGCACPLCATVVAASSLRTRKVRSADRKLAARLKEERLSALAAELGITLTDERRTSLLEREGLDEQLALVTWADQLLQRMAGDPGSPALLALWRGFAWERSGAPKKGFQVDADQIAAAETVLVAALRE